MDKKSQHVGNHGGRYVDNDNQSKQFTYIDHDKKTKIRTGKMSKDEVTKLKEEVRQNIEDIIDIILSLPAYNTFNNNGLYEEFIYENNEGDIVWYPKMVRDACRVNDILRHNLYLTVWRNTVSEANWFIELTKEEILAGKWEELM